AEWILLRAIHVAKGLEVIGWTPVFRQQVEAALDRLLDVILEHGGDQFVLADKIRIKRAARETGRGCDRFDTGAVNALFLEHPRRCLEQLVAGIVPGRSGSLPF